MSKNKIITTLIACFAVCSILASYLIYHYMSPSRGTVYVFNDDYEAGEQISSSMLIPVQVDSSIIVAGKKSDVSTQFVTPNEYAEVVRSGDSLRMDVSEGMPLTNSMLSVSGGSTVEMNMKSDAIAVTISVDQFTGITNDLKAGVRVNVYSNMNSQTRLIQQNKRVLEVFKEGSDIIGVSIEENIYESMELIYAATNGSVYLGLVDATGYQASEGEDPTYTPYESNSDTDMDVEEYLQYLEDLGGLATETEKSSTELEENVTETELETETPTEIATSRAQ